MTNLTDALREIEKPPTQEAWRDHLDGFVRHDVDDAESSDLGRSPRFPSGWWIVPVLICGLAFWASIIWLAFTPDANADGRQFSNDVKEFESD